MLIMQNQYHDSLRYEVDLTFTTRSMLINEMRIPLKLQNLTLADKKTQLTGSVEL